MLLALCMIVLNSLLDSLALTYLWHSLCFKGKEKTLINFGIPLICSYTIFIIIISMGVFSKCLKF